MDLKHNKGRIEAFSDAVFAFAATLLVVSVAQDESTSVLQIDWVLFISFAVSFFVLLSFWWLHYNFFRRTKELDNSIIVINSILLFVVLYYVFPLKSLLSSMSGRLRLSAEDFSSLFQLYSLGFLLIFSCFMLMYYRAYQLTKKEKVNLKLLFYVRHFSIYIIIAIISIILAKLKIGLKFGLPGFVYALLGPLCYFNSVRFHKKYKIV